MLPIQSVLSRNTVNLQETEREIERRPEGAKLKQLKELKTKALDVVMESGTPDTLAIALDQVSKKIGLTWNTDVQALPNFKQAG